MKQRKDGDRIIINGKVATVHLRPAKNSGLQLIIYDHPHTWELRDWRELAKAEGAKEAADD